MTLRLFVLFMVLLALIGLLTVHEEAARLRTGYRIAELERQREESARRVARLETDVAFLCRPERLRELNRELNLGLGPLPIREHPQQVAVSTTDGPADGTGGR